MRSDSVTPMEVPEREGSTERNKGPSRKPISHVVTTRKWIPKSTLTTTISIIAALLFCGLLMMTFGANPIKVYALMFHESFGTAYAWNQTLLQAIPLLLCGLGVAFAYRIAIWNIGAEGQFVIGAAAATGMTIYFPHLPGYIMIPAMVITGMTGGALWGLLAAIPRAYLQVNELITTLMLNYIGDLFMNYLVFGPWKDPKGFNFPGTPMFTPSEELPMLFGTQVHIGLLFALVGVLVYGFIFARTRWGYELRLLGANPEVARYAGIRITRQIILVLAISGALAGLGGMAEVSGVTHQLQQGFSPGYGYTAIIVAWLARLNPVGLIISSILFGAVMVGGYSVQTIGLPSSMTLMFQGAILFFAVAGEYVRRYGFRIGRSHAKEEIA